MNRKSKMRVALSTIAMCAAFAATALASAQAPTAPMGWNSWDAYGLNVNEAEFRANATVLRDKLLPFGWRYAVIDEGWFFEDPQVHKKSETLRYAIDTFGRYVPAPERYPSAQAHAVNPAHESSTAYKLDADTFNSSLKPLGDWVHAQGLLFGIHIVHGIPRASVERNTPIEGSAFHAQDAADTADVCPWDPTNWGVKDNAAGQAWYDSLIRQYAAWGVDLLKVDCISHNPYRGAEIRMLRRAIDKVGRPMVLSLSPGPTDIANAAEVNRLATMWRISNDVWDVWQSPADKGFPQSIRGQFEHAAQWAPIDLSAGHYADLDMLPFGELRPSPNRGMPRHTQLTLEEERTAMTLWAMMRSPLMLGANLTMLDDATMKLLTNREVLAIDQLGSHTRIVLDEKDQMVWEADLPDGRHAIAVFNLGDASFYVAKTMTLLPSGSRDRRTLPRDVWTGKKILGASEVQPHGCILAIGY